MAGRYRLFQGATGTVVVPSQGPLVGWADGLIGRLISSSEQRFNPRRSLHFSQVFHKLVISDPVADRGFGQGTGKSGSPLDGEAVGCCSFRTGLQCIAKKSGRHWVFVFGGLLSGVIPFFDTASVVMA